MARVALSRLVLIVLAGIISILNLAPLALLPDVKLRFVPGDTEEFLHSSVPELPSIDTTAFIVGITRDNAATLPRSIVQMEAIGSLFADHKIIVVENDSIDGTVAKLNSWAERNPRVHLDLQRVAWRTKKRPSIAFLASQRNRYLDALRSLPVTDGSVLIVMDMDMTAIDLRGVLRAAELVSEGLFVGLTANGITGDGRYYDVFALRAPALGLVWNTSVQGIIYDEKQESGPRVDSDQFERWCPSYKPSFKTSYCAEGEGGRRFVGPVESAFSGIAVYNAGLASACEYASVDGDCEHVAFSRCINANASAGDGAEMKELHVATFMTALYDQEFSPLKPKQWIGKERPAKYTQGNAPLELRVVGLAAC
jgi:hypothetical protein